MKDTSPTFSIKLVDFLDCLLGTTDKQEVKAHIAELVEIVAKDKQLCFVEWPDEVNLISKPRIWRWKDWITANDRIERQRLYSHQQRVKRFIFEANVRMVASFCRSYFLMDEGKATETAFTLVKNEKMVAIRNIGCKKLITKEEEL